MIAIGFSIGLAILWDQEQIRLTNIVESANLLSIDFIFMNYRLKGTVANIYGPTNPTLN